jgi:hypothetical protein
VGSYQVHLDVAEPVRGYRYFLWCYLYVSVDRGPSTFCMTMPSSLLERRLWGALLVMAAQQGAALTVAIPEVGQEIVFATTLDPPGKYTRWLMYYDMKAR